MLKTFIEALAIILQSLDQLFDRVGQLFDDMFAAFPNPIKMVDAVVRFLTGLAGIAVGKSASFYFGLAAGLLEKGQKVEEFGRPYQHLMTPANAMRYVGRQVEVSITTLTNTSENGLAFFLAQRIGLWFWQLFKRFKLILGLLGIKDAADAVNFIWKLVTSRVGAVWATAVFAVFGLLLVVSSATTGLLVFLAVGVLEPMEWQKFVCNWKNPRQKEKVRISRRVGGVKP